MLGAGKGGGLKITSKIAKYIQHLKTGIEGNAMHQGPLEMLTVNVCFIYIYKKKNKSKSLLPCLLRQMRRSSFPAAFCYPFGSLVPLSTQVCQAMTADRYKLICPRASWHMNSGELCELEERKKLSLFCLEKSLLDLLQSCMVCQVHCSRLCCSPYSSLGVGECHAAASSLAPRFTWKHSKLLSF